MTTEQSISNVSVQTFDISPCDDPENKGCVLYPDQYNLLWKVSHLCIVSCLYATYRGYYDLAATALCIFISSVNYWQKPDYSWRRYADMACVYLVMAYQIVRAYNSQYRTLYYVLLFISVSFFPLGNYFYSIQQYWYSTYAHCMLHVVANISNWVLYSGYILPLANMFDQSCDINETANLSIESI